MEDQLVKFETAKLAKEKGFQEPTFNYYLKDGNLKCKIEESCGESEYLFDFTDFNENWNLKNYSSTMFSAPTQSLLQKWLREIHNIHIIPPMKFGDKYACSLLIPKSSTKMFNTYEEALEVDLYRALGSLSIDIK